jgi:hypothetical protein
VIALGELSGFIEAFHEACGTDEEEYCLLLRLDEVGRTCQEAT